VLRHSTSNGIQSPQDSNIIVAFLPEQSPANLLKLDRPMIKSPGLVTLDHSPCAFCKTLW